MHWADLPRFTSHRSRSLQISKARSRGTELRNAHAVSDMGISTLSWIERGRDGEPGSPSALPLSVASPIDGRRTKRPRCSAPGFNRLVIDRRLVDHKSGVLYV